MVLMETGSGRQVRYPLHQGSVQVPVSSRRAALAGVSMFMACRPTVVAAHHAGWLALAAFGPRLLPGRREPLTPPVAPEIWERLAQEWRRELGPFDEVSVVSRRQISRRAIHALLLDRGRPVAFVKGRPDIEGLERERRALVAIASGDQAPFRTCRFIGQGDAAGWHWLAMSPLPVRPHRPERRPRLDAILEYVRSTIGDAGRPTHLPTHWVPMHGDLTPWNLRRLRGETWLLDWEDAAWGPPDADRVYWTVARAAISGRQAEVVQGEASLFWEAIVRVRLQQQVDVPLNGRMLAALTGGASDRNGER